MNRFLFGLVALGMYLGVTRDAVGQYIYTTIDVPGSMATQAFGINDSGQIVGNYGALNLWPQGFLLQGGSYTTLNLSGFGTYPRGINSAGQMAGYVTIAVSDHPWRSTEIGFLFSAGANTELGVPNSDDTQAFGINASGQIVGTSSLGGFLYSGGIYTIPDPLPSASPFGINDSSQIVGQYDDLAGTHGFLLSDGSYTTFDVPGAAKTVATAINNAGQIVGWYVDGGGINHGFLLSGGTYTTVDVPGSLATFAFGINNAGRIVGYYADDHTNHGFLATPVAAFAWHGPEPIATGVTGNPSLVQATPRTYGTKGNYELVVPLLSGGIGHFERNNDDPNLPWSGPVIFATDQGTVDALSLIQSNFSSAGNGPGYLAVVARVGNELIYLFREDITFTWNTATPFFSGASGVPSVIQARPGTYGAMGNYELVTPLESGGIGYLERSNDDPSFPWTAPIVFGTELGVVDAVSLIQSNFSTAGSGPGNLAVVARAGNDLFYFYRDDVDPFAWHGPEPILSGVAGVLSLVQTIPGSYGIKGNYELVVPLQNGGIGSFYRNNDDPTLSWSGPTVFATELGAVHAVTLIQSNFSTAGSGPGNLAVVSAAGGEMKYFYRDD